jgi:Fe-S-cluster containining protein
MTVKENQVPCAGCTACCQNEVLILHPEQGDDIAAYEAEEVTNPFDGERAWKLKNAANGDCIYLDRATGCTIWERRPASCREFDCRRYFKMFMSWPVGRRRKFQKTTPVDKAVLAAGRRRLASLRQEEVSSAAPSERA